MKKSIVLLLFVVFLLTVSVVSAEPEAQNAGDKSLYDKAYSLYQNGKYFNAHELFVQSQYGDWERMAKKCIRRWPKNGEVWHDDTQWLRDTHLTFKVEQSDDTAVFIRIYKDNAPLSYVFVGGTDTVTVGVPGNQKYTIKDGVGSDWFGMTDTFGTTGAYETMTFEPNDSETVFLMARYNYTITINVEDAIGEPIGSEDEVWENFNK